MLGIMERYQEQNLLKFNVDKMECRAMEFSKNKRCYQSNNVLPSKFETTKT